MMTILTKMPKTNLASSFLKVDLPSF
eukprot:COSAG02_NODE_11059_length_1803_cov_2.507042_3_plen_25_part_01